VNKTYLLAAAIAMALPGLAAAQAVDDVGGTAPASSGHARTGLATKAILAESGSFTGAEPVMSPRFFRDGSPIEGEGCSTFSSGNFQYQVIPFTTDGSGTLTASVDIGTCGVNMFATFHDGPFNPGSICDNFFYDYGSSTSFTQAFSVPADTDMVMVLSGVSNAPGVVCDFSYSLDGVRLAVELTVPGSNSPVLVADELIIPPSRTITNGGNLDIQTAIEYAFSPGEVRYARIHCPGVQFAPGTAVSFDGDPSNLIGAVNGVGGDAIYFSITAGATPVVITDRLSVNGDRVITSKGPVDCTYGLYDFPSQAQAGGPTGRVVQTSGAYIRFAPSYGLRVDEQGNPIANVESNDPAYSEFELGAPTFTELLGNVGRFSYGTAQQLAMSSQPITLDGAAIELADLMAANTALIFSGDFEAAGDVYLSPGSDCSINAQSADSFDDTEAVFTIGSNAFMNHYLCYETIPVLRDQRRRDPRHPGPRVAGPGVGLAVGLCGRSARSAGPGRDHPQRHRAAGPVRAGPGQLHQPHGPDQHRLAGSCVRDQRLRRGRQRHLHQQPDRHRAGRWHQGGRPQERADRLHR